MSKKRWRLRRIETEAPHPGRHVAEHLALHLGFLHDVEACCCRACEFVRALLGSSE